MSTMLTNGDTPAGPWPWLGTPGDHRAHPAAKTADTDAATAGDTRVVARPASAALPETGFAAPACSRQAASPGLICGCTVPIVERPSADNTSAAADRAVPAPAPETPMRTLSTWGGAAGSDPGILAACRISTTKRAAALHRWIDTILPGVPERGPTHLSAASA